MSDPREYDSNGNLHICSRCKKNIMKALAEGVTTPIYFTTPEDSSSSNPVSQQCCNITSEYLHDDGLHVRIHQLQLWCWGNEKGRFYIKLTNSSRKKLLKVINDYIS
jgi:hypothetical protein